jgi:hypothetical protein
MAAKGRAKTLYLSNDVIELLGGGGSNLSAALTVKMQRYAQILARSKPNFTPAEWDFLHAVLRGFSADRPEHLRGIGGYVKSWPPTEGQARPPGVDPTSLAYRIEGLTFAQLVALVEAIETGAKKCILHEGFGI